MAAQLLLRFLSPVGSACWLFAAGLVVRHLEDLFMLEGFVPAEGYVGRQLAALPNSGITAGAGQLPAVGGDEQ